VVGDLLYRKVRHQLGVRQKAQQQVRMIQQLVHQQVHQQQQVQQQQVQQQQVQQQAMKHTHQQWEAKKQKEDIEK
jgi:acid phosphatase family membrane protein YuiD